MRKIFSILVFGVLWSCNAISSGEGIFESDSTEVNNSNLSSDSIKSSASQDMSSSFALNKSSTSPNVSSSAVSQSSSLSSSSQQLMSSPSSSTLSSSSAINTLPPSLSSASGLNLPPPTYGTLVDERDGNTYRIIKIGSATWMAENLRYLPKVNSFNFGTGTDRYYVNEYTGHDVQEAKALSNYGTYGVFYNWNAAQMACPSGWHVPDQAEWDALIEAVGGAEMAGARLKVDYDWKDEGYGTNDYGFSALGSGWFNAGKIMQFKTAARWWSTQPKGDSIVVRQVLNNRNGISTAQMLKYNAAAVRCIQGETIITSSSSASHTIEYDSFVDERDGNVYKTVQIGNLIWMAENLRYLTHLSDGDSSSIYPKHYVYGYAYDDLVEAKATKTYQDYGVLYNWAAANEACPPGWRLPLRAEWSSMISKHGGTNMAAFSLKNTDGWYDKGNGINVSGLGLSGGGIFTGTDFKDLHRMGYWWINDTKNSSLYRILYNEDQVVFSYYSKYNGVSIRCVQEPSP